MNQLYDATTNSFVGKTQNMNELGQVMWHITNHCMLNCALCFTKKMRRDTALLQKEKIPEYIMLLKELGVKKVDVSGGEPLLYPHLPLLVTLCTQEGIAVTVTTSGLGQKENIDWILQNWSLFSRIILSLDGGEKLHNSLRGSEKAFEAFWTFQQQLKKAGCNNMRINTIVSKPLLEVKERESICELVADSEVLEWCLIEPYPINKTEKFDRLTVENRDFCDFVAQCKATPLLSNVNIVQRTNSDYEAYWSLFCDGYLYYSNNREYYDVQIKLTATNLEEIIREVMKHPQKYILKRMSSDNNSEQ